MKARIALLMPGMFPVVREIDLPNDPDLEFKDNCMNREAQVYRKGEQLRIDHLKYIRERKGDFELYLIIESKMNCEYEEENNYKG